MDIIGNDGFMGWDPRSRSITSCCRQAGAALDITYQAHPGPRRPVAVRTVAGMSGMHVCAVIVAAATSATAAHQASLSSDDVDILDRVVSHLRSPSPWFHAAAPSPADWRSAGLHPVVAVCGNWYDGIHKASLLARAAADLSDADLLLTGGRAERLTPAEAIEAGGEPVLLQQQLRGLGVAASRLVLWTGSRVTTHNLLAAMHYAKQYREFHQRPITLTVVEEGFLVRREAATLARLLAADADARVAIARVRFRAVGPRRFDALVAVHGGRVDVALALVMGELDRMERYTRAGNGSTATHGSVLRGAVLPTDAATAGMPSSLASAAASLRARHVAAGGLLEQGRRVLGGLRREETLRIAAPRQRGRAGSRLRDL